MPQYNTALGQSLGSLLSGFAGGSSAKNDGYSKGMQANAYAANAEESLAKAAKTAAEKKQIELRTSQQQPEAMRKAALMGAGIIPESERGLAILQQILTGKAGVNPAQPAIETLDTGDNSLQFGQDGMPTADSVMRKPAFRLNEVAPARPATNKPDDPQLADIVRRVGAFMSVGALTGDTNYEQFESGRGKAAQNDMLTGAMRGERFTDQALALGGAKDIYNTQGVNSFDGKGGQAFVDALANAVRINNDDNATTRRGQDVSAQSSRYGTNVGAATSRRGQDVSASTSRRGQDITDRRGRDNNAADNVTREKVSKKTGKVSEADSDEINSVDLGAPIVPQVSLDSPDYQQFASIHKRAAAAGDKRTLRALLHRAEKNGLIRRD